MKSLTPISTLVGATSVATAILTDSALKSIAVIVVAIGIATLLRRASAATRHTVWLSAMAALLTLPLLSNSLPRWQVLPATLAWGNPATPATTPTPLAPELALSPLPASPHSPPTNPAPSPAETAPAKMADVTFPSPSSGPAVSWVILCWGLGVAFLLLRLVRAHWSLRRQASSLRESEDEELDGLFSSLKSTLAVTDTVRLLIGREQEMPKTFGFLRPSVILPTDSKDWDRSRLRAVLAHELGHIKRRDPLAQLLVQITCALYWFNPLVWLGARLMESERERACDDLVLNNGFKASDYAKHLLDVVTACDSSRFEACASVGMARPSRLEGRVVSILDNGVNRRSITRALLCLAIIGTFATVVPLAMVGAQKAKTPELEPTTGSSQPAKLKPVPLPPQKADFIDMAIADKARDELPGPGAPPKLAAPKSNQQQVIRDFYRFFLNREPSAGELRSMQKSWTQEDYHRVTQQMAGVRKMNRSVPINRPKLNPPDFASPAPMPGLPAPDMTPPRAESFNRPPAALNSIAEPIRPIPGLRSNPGSPISKEPSDFLPPEKANPRFNRTPRPSKTTEAFPDFPTEAKPPMPSPEPIFSPKPSGSSFRRSQRTTSTPTAPAIKQPGAVPNADTLFRSLSTPPPPPAPVVQSRVNVSVQDDEMTGKDSTNGKLRWVTKFDEDIALGTPIVSGSRIYVTDKSGIIHCIDKRTGRVIWDCEDDKKMDHKEIVQAYRDVLGKSPAKNTDDLKLLTEIQHTLKGKSRVRKPTTNPFDEFATEQLLPPQPTATPTPAVPVQAKRKELIDHWTELVRAREQMRDSVKRQNMIGAASSTSLNQAEQALTESRIGLAKARQDRKSVQDELTRLVGLLQSQSKRQDTLRRNGLLSERQILQTREALLEAKIRLAEYQMNSNRSSTAQMR